MNKKFLKECYLSKFTNLYKLSFERCNDLN